MFFFFKQKTAYEMRISDWSSDVCSSDLCGAQVLHHLVGLQHVGANLVTPADIGLRVGLGLGRRLALLQFVLVEAGAQPGPSLGAVLVLRAVALAGDRYSGQEGGRTHRPLVLVDVLATGP